MLNSIRYTTREQWLEAAVEYYRQSFANAGKPLPDKVRVAIGFPSKGGIAKRRTLGQCWKPEAAEDSIVQIYINPTITEVGGRAGILATLVHELIHACGIFNHGAEFREMMRKLGLEGKPTSTVASEELQHDFEDIISELGECPHSPLTGNVKTSGQKKDGTRMLKATCLKCGYTIRLTKKWAEVGVPECPCGRAQLKMDKLITTDE